MEAQLTKLRTSLVAIRPPEGHKLSFDLQAEIKAVSKQGSKVKLRYAIGIETFPLIYRAELAGVATAEAEKLTKEEDLEKLGEAALGDMALQIFRQNYEPLYLALSAQGLDAPSPWLVRDVHLVK